MLDKLIKNKGIQKILLSQFNEIVKTEGIKFIGITIKESGELVPDLYTKEMVCIDRETYTAIMEKIKSSTDGK
jgi:hypothetical protein